MDMVLLRSLLAVADSGTITDAAERIHVSQSALSRRLQQLEAELGTELLVRGSHGVELTDLGRQTVERSRGIVVPPSVKEWYVLKGGETPSIPHEPRTAAPRGDDGAVNETARLLVAAESLPLTR